MTTVAQTQKKRKRVETQQKVEVEEAKVPEVALDTVPAIVPDTLKPAEPEPPKDRTDTLYYDRSWRVISNKTFATYYRYVLYPVDSLAPKYFKTFYLDGQLQGEGTFITMGERSDKESVFDGEVVYYYKGGAVKQRLTYAEGKPNGERTDYYENGNIHEHITLKDGMRTGIFASFSEDGIV